MDAREHVIVCGVDGSSASQLALGWAIDEAIRRDCKLRAVTAWSWDGLEALEAPPSPAAARSNAQDIQEAAIARASTAAENLPEIERLMSRGVPSEVLCAAALDAELMVLGSHGRGALHDRLVGSTSQRAIHHASCPVVILPDPRHAEREIKRAKAKRRHAEAPQATASF